MRGRIHSTNITKIFKKAKEANLGGGDQDIQNQNQKNTLLASPEGKQFIINFSGFISHDMTHT